MKPTAEARIRSLVRGILREGLPGEPADPLERALWDLRSAFDAGRGRVSGGSDPVARLVDLAREAGVSDRDLAAIVGYPTWFSTVGLSVDIEPDPRGRRVTPRPVDIENALVTRTGPAPWERPSMPPRRLSGGYL